MGRNQFSPPDQVIAAFQAARPYFANLGPLALGFDIPGPSGRKNAPLVPKTAGANSSPCEPGNFELRARGGKLMKHRTSQAQVIVGLGEVRGLFLRFFDHVFYKSGYRLNH